MPQRFLIRHPSAVKEEEIAQNSSGRVANAGFEGLALSVDGATLYAVLQAPLLQDSDSAGPERVGLNVRLLEIDLASKRSRELMYRLDRRQNKLSEILVIDPTQFLVIERDGEPGRRAKYKRIMKIDIRGASDVSGIHSLSAKGAVDDVHAVGKSTFIDLLEPRFGLAGDSLPEKQEGLAWGPSLPDGRRLLWIAVDNDFKADAPTIFYAFAVAREPA